MDNIFADATFWQIVGYLLGAALTLLVIVLTARYTTLWSARTVTEVRVILNQVQRQLDEPDDPLIQLLDRYIPGQADAVLVQVLPAMLRAAAEALERLEPVREVVLDEATK